MKHLVLSLFVLAACGPKPAPAPIPTLPGDGDAHVAKPPSPAPAVADAWAGRTDLITAPAAAPPAAVELPRIDELKLSNGLQVYVVKSDRLPVVSFQLAVRAGRMHEPRTRLGVAEFTADMLVKGSRSRDALALAKAIDFVGGTIAADATFEATLVSCSVLARDTSTCLKLLPEVVTQPTFPEAEITKVREQLLEGVEDAPLQRREPFVVLGQVDQLVGRVGHLGQRGVLLLHARLVGLAGDADARRLAVAPHALDAEQALTPREQQTGMMFRTIIQDSDAMIFVFPGPFQASFWMKNCPESISAAYIDPVGVIQEIHHLEKNDTNGVVAATSNIQFVLETSDGWFQRQLDALPESYVSRWSAATVAETLRRLRHLATQSGTAWGTYLPDTNTVEFVAGIEAPLAMAKTRSPATKYHSLLPTASAGAAAAETSVRTTTVPRRPVQSPSMRATTRTPTTLPAPAAVNAIPERALARSSPAMSLRAIGVATRINWLSANKPK